MKGKQLNRKSAMKTTVYKVVRTEAQANQALEILAKANRAKAGIEDRQNLLNLLNLRKPEKFIFSKVGDINNPSTWSLV